MTNEQKAIHDVIQSELLLADAHRELNLTTFDRLLHPDYINLQPNGGVEDKAETLASLQTGTRYWEIAQSDQFDVRIYGDTAVVISRWRGKGQNGSVMFDYQARILAVWVYENGRWQNVVAQSTPLDTDSTFTGLAKSS